MHKIYLLLISLFIFGCASNDSSSSSSSSAATGMVPNDITIIDDQVVITTQNKMKKFVKYLAKEFRHKCGGVMRLSWISSDKGFGGALHFTLECGKCGKGQIVHSLDRTSQFI